MSTCTEKICLPYPEGTHHPECRHQGDFQIRALLATLAGSIAGKNERIERLKREVTAAQGRFAILKVENNALRKKVSK